MVYCVQAFSAGVGNWVADEVLYQAQLYPEVKASTLTDAEICELHKALKDVPATAVAAEADSEKFPPDWLFHVRWGGPKKSPKVNGHPVEFLKVGGRVSSVSKLARLVYSLVFQRQQGKPHNDLAGLCNSKF